MFVFGTKIEEQKFKRKWNENFNKKKCEHFSSNFC